MVASKYLVMYTAGIFSTFSLLPRKWHVSLDCHLSSTLRTNTGCAYFNKRTPANVFAFTILFNMRRVQDVAVLSSLVLSLLLCLSLAVVYPKITTSANKLWCEKLGDEILSVQNYLTRQEQCSWNFLDSIFVKTFWDCPFSGLNRIHEEEAEAVFTSSTIANVSHTSEKRFSVVRRYTFHCEIHIHLVAEISEVEDMHIIGRPTTDIFIFVLMKHEHTREKICSLEKLKWKFYVRSDRLHLLPCDVSHAKVDRRLINLNKAYLRISGLVNAPYMLVHPKSPKEITGGTFVTLFHVASKHFNFTYDISTERKPSGKKVNGTWIGIIGDLIDRKQDMGMALRVTHERFGILDYTQFMFYERSIFILAHPRTYTRWDSLMRPLPPLAWLLTVIAFLLFIPLLYITLNFHARTYTDKTDLLYRSAMYPVAAALEQELKLPDETRLLTASWTFFCLLLGVLYSDKLLLELTFPHFEPIPLNLEQVHTRPDFRMVFHFWGSTMIDRFRNKHNPMLLSLGKRLILEPDGGKCVYEAVVKPRTLCLGIRSFLSVHMAKNATLSTGFQSYKTSEDIFFPIYISFPLQKDSIYTAAWDELAGRFRESGLLRKWNEDILLGFRKQGRKWIMSQNTSGIYNILLGTMLSSESSGQIPLAMRQVFVVIVIYLFLTICCLLIFSTEIRHVIMDRGRRGFGETARKHSYTTYIE